MILTLNKPGMKPLHICAYPPVENCEEMIVGTPQCETCEDGYFLSADQLTCGSCGIDMCEECELLSLPNLEGESFSYTSCTECDEPFQLVNWMFESQDPGFSQVDLS